MWIVTLFQLAKFVSQKTDKWTKMASQDENTVMLMEFLEKAECRLLIVYSNSQGQLTPTTTYPGTTKTKVRNQQERAR